MKKRTRIILITLAALLLLGCASMWYLYKSRSPMVAGFRRWAKTTLATLGVRGKGDSLDGAHDALPDGWVLVEDDVIGFALGLPAGVQRIETAATGIAVFEGEGLKAVVSREWSVEADARQYANHYFNRFVLDADFRAANGVTLLSEVSETDFDRVHVQLDGYETDAMYTYDTYIYAHFYTATPAFYRVMVKYDSTAPVAAQLPNAIDETFRSYRGQDILPSTETFRPVANPHWNDETRAFYERICDADDVLWGIFVVQAEEIGLEETIPAMEEKIGYPFELLLDYSHISYRGEQLTLHEGLMQKAYEHGKVVELTYQLTDHNNEKLFDISPMMELYKTGDSETVRAFARAVADFGHPFLFRLNNEMNSDWTNYSGVVNMQDPDIYVAVWRLIYEIFEEEGVDNAIWIWNPHDRSYPPAEWNNYLAYYPGDEYVHMLGITGYNNGTYYAQRNNEKWREFDEIYAEITAELGGNFDEFPWIITEFASSSVGGDKVKWIDNMFANLHKYENIKIAVWFSAADLDEDKNVARPYWLDETEETLAAFRRGREQAET